MTTWLISSAVVVAAVAIGHAILDLLHPRKPRAPFDNRPGRWVRADVGAGETWFWATTEPTDSTYPKGGLR